MNLRAHAFGLILNFDIKIVSNFLLLYKQIKMIPCQYCISITIFVFKKMPQLGLDVGGSFNIHIWACSGDFIVKKR